MSENPTLEEPQGEPTVESAPVDEAQEIAAKLTELGIDDLGKVEGTVKAAQEAGRLANMLGEERAARQELERRLRETQSQRVDVGNDDYGIDLEKAIDRGFEKFWSQKQNEAQQMQQRNMQEFQKIRSNKNYKLVGKEFEEYTKTPDYQSELMAGKTPSEIFNDMSTNKLREYLVTMKNAYESKTIDPSQVAVPHTEQAQASPPAPEPDNEREEKLKNIRKDWKGDDSDLSKALDVILG